MPDNQPKKEPATMQTLVARLQQARPNTVIKGSANPNPPPPEEGS